LTPLIEAGDIEAAQDAARVTDSLPGLSGNDQPESYSGYITVDEATDSHIYFWFFPATVYFITLYFGVVVLLYIGC